MSNHVTIGIEPPPPSEASFRGPDLEPVGVERERVDPHTLQVIEQLFPAPTNGSEFLAHLLRWAIVKQLSHGLEESSHVAVVTVQSIRALAKLIGWSYEATHKYVVLFCALGLLTKHRTNGRVELHFALNRYEPPLTLAELDRLTGTRKKVASCARRVKCRFLLLYGDRQREHLLPPAPPVVMSPQLPELHDALLDMQQLLQTEIPDAMRQRLITIQAKLEQAQGRLSAKLGDSSPQKVPTQGRLVAPMGDSASQMATRNGRLSRGMVDSVLQESQEHGRLSNTKVDSSATDRQKDERPSPKKSTFSPPANAQHGRFSTQDVDLHSKKVDSSAADSTNVNVIIYQVIDSLNVNVGPVAEYLRTIFEEAPAKRGYYHNLYKEYRNADAWLAAAIETLIGLHLTGTVRQPGKYFYGRCVALHQQGISPETAALVKQYGSFTYLQLLEVLKKVPPAPTKGVQPAHSPAPRRQLLHLHLPREKHRSGMSREDLKRLLSLIEHDLRTCDLLVQPYLQADNTCVLLIEDPLKRQRWVYSLREWHECLARMQTLQDLFS